jgi:hypothetical protein
MTFWNGSIVLTNVRHLKNQGLFLLFSAVSVVLFFGASLWHSTLNQDEGWYLYAARMVFEGKMLYRDFHFAQGPLLPFVYGAIYPLWSNAGVLGGRLLTSFLALMAIGLASATAFRLCRHTHLRHAACITTLWLAGFCVFGVNYLSIVKTYALTALFFSAGALALTYISGPRESWAAMACGIFFASAAGTRFSMGVTLPIVGLSLLFGRRGTYSRWSWCWFGAGSALTLLAIWGPFLITSQEILLFNLAIHGKRDTGNWQTQLLFKAGFAARCVQSFLAPLLVTLLAIFVNARRKRQATHPLSPALMLWLSIGGITLLHFLTPFPYDDYQVPLLPVFTALAAAALWNGLASGFPEDGLAAALTNRRILALLIAGILMIAAASPVFETWAIIRQDRLWFTTKHKPDLAALREIGMWIRDRSNEKDELLTWDPYLAVESRRRLPHGFELAPFNFFPELSDADARRIGVLNKNLMLETVKNVQAPIAAISGYAMAIRSPRMEKIEPSDPLAKQVWQTIETRYTPALQIENFGQGHTTLSLFTLKSNH